MRAAYLCPLLLLAACSREREPEPKQHVQPSAVMTGELPKQMRNCPSAVPSAKTTARPTTHGVEISITSDDREAQRRIVALANLQASFRDPITMMPPHTGMHSGPGTVGRCPIIHAGTTVRYEETPNGVRVHVAVADRAPNAIKRLQVATAARIRALETPSS